MINIKIYSLGLIFQEQDKKGLTFKLIFKSMEIVKRNDIENMLYDSKNALISNAINKNMQVLYLK